MSEFSFTKLFSNITKSTVWCEPHTTLRVWITMLADCDRNGCVYAAVPGLANLARVTVEECEAALQTFLEPDSYSRTPDNEGRRIEAIPGGWKLLNYELYRERRDDAARREQNRDAQQRHRERQQASAGLLTDDDKPKESAQGRGQRAEGIQDQEQEPKEQVRSRGSRLPTDWQPTEVEIQWAKGRRPDLDINEEIEKFRDHWTSMAGKAGVRTGWSGTWRTWIRNAWVKGSNRPPNTKSATHAGFDDRAYGQGGAL